MIKTNFQIPDSAMIIVRWFRNNTFHDTKIPRPANNEMLRLTMLQKHRVGFGEIRAIKPDRETSTPTSADLKSLAHRFNRQIAA